MDLIRKVVNEFRGAWTYFDQLEARSDRAFIAENMQFAPNRARMRDGFASKFTVAAKVTALYSWLAVGLNRLIYQEGTAVKLWDYSTSPITLFTNPDRAFVCADVSTQLYFATFSAPGQSTQQVRVVSTTLPGLPADKAFAAPGAFGFTVAATTAGTCTVGSHLLAYVIQSRTGFLGKPGPMPGISLAPVTATVSSGGKKIDYSFTSISVPSDAATVYMLMTRVDNPDIYYFVPGASFAVPAGMTFSYTGSIDITDEDLAARGTEATNQFSMLSQDSGGTGPIAPSFIFAYGQRLVYLTGNKAYVSDKNNFQSLTEDLNALIAPGQRTMYAGFALRGVMYLLGDNWTYSYTDNGDSPRLWAPPQPVSEKIGTTAPNGVCSRTSGDFAWVVAQSGLYVFNGQYPTMPISYRNSDIWQRINWAYAKTIQVTDSPERHQVRVLVPLDGALEPTHVLCWDYTRGLDVDDVDFSLEYFATDAVTTGSTQLSALAVVFDPSTSKDTVYVGPAGAGYVLFQQVDRRNDNSQAIAAIYEPGFFLQNTDDRWAVEKFLEYFLAVRGSGTLHLTVYSKDRRRSKALLDATLGTGLEKELHRKGLMQSENATIRLSMNSAGYWFDLQYVRVLYNHWLKSR